MRTAKEGRPMPPKFMLLCFSNGFHAFSLNSLAVRVPHNSSRTSTAQSDPGLVGRPGCPVARGSFYSKTNGFSTFLVARFVKPMVFQRFWLPDLSN